MRPGSFRGPSTLRPRRRRPGIHRQRRRRAEPAWAKPIAPRLAAVRLVAMLERIATPSAPPICCEVLNSPEARPASCGAMLVVAIRVIGTKTNPSPKPITIRPGRTSGRYEPAAGARESRMSPMAAVRVPPNVTARTPKRGIRRCAKPDAAMTAPVSGRKPEPHLDGRQPKDVLQVERREEEHGEHAAGDHEHRGVCSAQRPGAEDVEAHQGMRRA